MDSDKLASALATARVNARLKQRDVADQCGVKPLAVSRWERGVAMPSDAAIVYLRALFPSLRGLLAEAAKDAARRRCAPRKAA